MKINTGLNKGNIAESKKALKKEEPFKTSDRVETGLTGSDGGLMKDLKNLSQLKENAKMSDVVIDHPKTIYFRATQNDQYKLDDGFDSSRDIVAVGAQEGNPSEPYRFMIKFKELQKGAELGNLDTYVLLDMGGGTKTDLPDGIKGKTEKPWQLAVAAYDSKNYNVYDHEKGTLDKNRILKDLKYDSSRNILEFSIDKEALRERGWEDLKGINLQVFTAKDFVKQPLDTIDRAPEKPWTKDGTMARQLNTNPYANPDKIEDWGGKGIYFLLTDRFNDGDPTNNMDVDKGDLGKFHGGDLQGIIDKLDYLQSLGVTAIYLNPIFESPSLHKYDAIMYHHIDANFGPDSVRDRELIKKEVPHDPGTWVMTSADKLFLKLIKEVHKRKMKIIIDGVFNHIGIKNPFFQDVVKNQENSKYKDWFIVTSWNDPAKGKEFTYKGWFGVKELPEWGRTDNNLLPGPKSYIFNITKRWMDPDCDGDPSDGIDGWRLDVAFCVPHGFWKDWSKHVKSINPEAYMTAEIIDTAEVNKPYLKGDEFTAVMNYNFAFTSSEYFFDEHNRISTTEFDKRLRELREAYNKEISYVMQNLIDSHDTARMNTMIVNKDKISYRDWHKYCEYAKGSNPEYDTGKPLPNEIKRQKIFVIFQMTYLGSPMVYYGNEVGMWGATDPCCRKPMIWEDMEYSDEIYLPDGSKRSVPDKVGVNKDLFNHYKKLINIRNSHKALQLGDFNTLFIDDKNEIYGFSRKYKDEYIVVIVNNSKKEKRAKFEVELPGTFVDLLNEGNGFTVKEDKTISLDVKGEWGRILLLENK